MHVRILDDHEPTEEETPEEASRVRVQYMHHIRGRPGCFLFRVIMTGIQYKVHNKAEVGVRNENICLEKDFTILRTKDKVWSNTWRTKGGVTLRLRLRFGTPKAADRPSSQTSSNMVVVVEIGEFSGCRTRLSRQQVLASSTSFVRKTCAVQPPFEKEKYTVRSTF